MKIKKLLFIFGTRPEAIKMAPLIKLAESKPYKFEVSVCITAQHREMLDQVMNFFEIKANHDLNLMKPNQDLFALTSDCLKELKNIIDIEQPDLILVQGDTTTAFVGALAGFYSKVKVAHIEAGLRSGDKQSPFPEEGNRTLIGGIADYHFAPTDNSVDALKQENIKSNVYKVGNTVIDALLLGLDIINRSGEKHYNDYFSWANFNKKIILVTSHRRENFGKPLENICIALARIAKEFPEIQIIFPVHLNPNVRLTVNNILLNINNVKLIEPLDYPYLIWLMQKSYIIITDSGGIQEEAPSLGKPVLVTRDVTERIEGIEAGTAKLVGTDENLIFHEVSRLFNEPEYYKGFANVSNPYGDGKASEYILSYLQ